MGQPGNQPMSFVHVRSHLTPSVPLHRHLDERDLNRTGFPSSPRTTSLPPSNAAHVAFAQTETCADRCIKLRCHSCLSPDAMQSRLHSPLHRPCCTRVGHEVQP